MRPVTCFKSWAAQVGLMILLGYVERRVVANEAIDGELAILLMNHANMHY